MSRNRSKRRREAASRTRDNVVRFPTERTTPPHETGEVATLTPIHTELVPLDTTDVRAALERTEYTGPEDEWPGPADTEPEWPDREIHWPEPGDTEPTWLERHLDDEPEDVDIVFGHDDPTAECEGCGRILGLGGHDEFCPVVLDPTEYVGMTAYSVRTMCRWTHRHIEDGLTEPQPCCYSVLITTSRLPGPVQEERNWLAYAGAEDGPA